mgnify:FL=1
MITAEIIKKPFINGLIPFSKSWSFNNSQINIQQGSYQLENCNISISSGAIVTVKINPQEYQILALRAEQQKTIVAWKIFNYHNLPPVIPVKKPDASEVKKADGSTLVCYKYVYRADGVFLDDNIMQNIRSFLQP